MSIRLVPATAHHAHIIARHMRGNDAIHVLAQTGRMPVDAIAAALAASPRYARVLFLDLVPLAMFGLSPLTVLGDSAQVWCFGTRHIDQHPILFLRQSRRILPQLLAQASVLTNLVADKDLGGRRWLSLLGASYVLQPRVLNGRLFDQFILAAHAKAGAQCQQG